MKSSMQVSENNETFFCTIESISDDGRGVAHSDGLTLFVRGAIPGERVRVSLTKKKKRYAFADVVERIAPSPFAVSPANRYEHCSGGAPLASLAYAEQLRQKEILLGQTLARIARFTIDADVFQPILGMQNPERYRNKARYACGIRKDGSVDFGSYLPDSHNILFEHDSILYKEENKAVIDECSAWACAYGTPSEPPCSELTIRSAQSGDMLIIISAKTMPAHIAVLVERLHTRFPAIVSIVWQSSIRAGQKKILYGSDVLHDRLGTITLTIPPEAFFQVNHLQTEALYAVIKEYAQLHGTEQVWDIYCGLGTISMWLADGARFLRGNELSTASIKQAKENARNNHIENVYFEAGDAAEIVPRWAQRFEAPDVVVLDPPRSGCDSRVIKSIMDCAPRRIVYVSCKPSTLARDLVAFCTAYSIKKIQPLDMFPHTAHLETVVLLERKA